MNAKAWMAVAAGMLPAQLGVAQVLHVDDDAPLGGDGQSWETAYRYLQDALYEAQTDASIEEIRIAAGTYRPDQDEAGRVVENDPWAIFSLTNRSLALKGGYRGVHTAGDPDDRGAQFQTNFTGEIGSPASSFDNSSQILEILHDCDIPQSELTRGIELSLLNIGEADRSPPVVLSAVVNISLDTCRFTADRGMSARFGVNQVDRCGVGFPFGDTIEIENSSFIGDMPIIESRRILLKNSIFRDEYFSQFGFNLVGRTPVDEQVIDRCTISRTPIVVLASSATVSHSRFEDVRYVRNAGPNAPGILEHTEFVGARGSRYPVLSVTSTDVIGCSFTDCESADHLIEIHSGQISGSTFEDCLSGRAFIDIGGLGSGVADSSFFECIALEEFIHVSGGDAVRFERCDFVSTASVGPFAAGVDEFSGCLISGHAVLDRSAPLMTQARRVLATTILVPNATGETGSGFIEPGVDGFSIDGSIIRVGEGETIGLLDAVVRDSVLGAAAVEGSPVLDNTPIASPVFVDPFGPDGISYTGDEDWSLASNSPGVDLARLGLLDGVGREDLDGNPRFVDATGDGVFGMDAGAFERQSGSAALCDAELLASGVGFAPDDMLEVADLARFVEQWIAMNPNADITTTRANPGDLNWRTPDGAVSIEDLTTYVELWINGCP